VEEECKRDPRIRWLGIVDDATLHTLYSEATFTVYASFIEGFGLPILESAWHGKPCLCHNDGVMKELAAGGGCLTADVNDLNAFSDAMVRLATDAQEYAELVRQAVARPIQTWPEYSRRVAAVIAGPSRSLGRGYRPSHIPWRLEDVLYPGCGLQDWQMKDSERLSLTGVLSRIQPICSIVVGAHHGGSLSLVSQFSRSAFSIDIDPAVPEPIGKLDNVSFLTGPSHLILPKLLTELSAVDIPVEVVLIDGNHSGEALRRDIEILLDYVPRKRMVLLLHDAFNPECRRRMLEVGWKRSKYLHWVDLDFVPGRVVERGGEGEAEMSGGLAMAYFEPTPRQGELVIQQSGLKAFEHAQEYSARNSQVIRCAS
jgi:hypothetical protein